MIVRMLCTQVLLITTALNSPLIFAYQNNNLGVAVLNTRIGPIDTTRKLVTVMAEVQNVSNDVITAIAYTVVARYADGTEKKTGALVDDVASLVADQLQIKNPAAKMLRPSESRRFDVFIPAETATDVPVAVSFDVKMTAFKSGAVQGDSGSVADLEFARKTQLDDSAAILAALDEVSKSSDKKQSLDNLASANSSGSGAAKRMVPILQGVSRAMSRDSRAFDRALSIYRARLNVLKEQSILKKEK